MVVRQDEHSSGPLDPASIPPRAVEEPAKFHTGSASLTGAGPGLQNRWRALRGVLGGFDSHALPPPTSRNCYCWGPSEAAVSSPSPTSAGASSSLIADSRAAGDRCMYLCVVLRCWCPASSWIDFAVASRIARRDIDKAL